MEAKLVSTSRVDVIYF